MNDPYSEFRRRTLAALLLCLSFATSTWAAPLYQNGVGGIAFGVTPLAGVGTGVPSYINNSMTGFNDILTNPGGVYRTANPIVPGFTIPGVPSNFTVSSGPTAGPITPPAIFLVQVGGGNGNGPFGTGVIVNTGTSYAFQFVDSALSGNSASYGIATTIATLKDPTGSPANFTFGGYLPLAGVFTALNSFAVAAERIEVTSANPNSPFFGGVTLPQMVLAAGVMSNGTPYNVAIGGPTGSNAVVINNGVTFTGLAIDNINNPRPGVAIPAGDVITVTSTLTLYADPVSLNSFSVDPILDANLISLTGTTLPTYNFVTAFSIPEPAAYLQFGTAMLGLCGCYGWRWRTRMRMRIPTLPS